MRFTYYARGTKRSVAFFYDNYLIDVNEALSLNSVSMREMTPSNIIEAAEAEKSKLEQLYQGIRDGVLACPEKLPLEHVRLLPPVSKDNTELFYVGRNYKTIQEEMNKATCLHVEELPLPAYFNKTNRSAIASGEPIMACYEDTSELDYEGEIGVVIGRTGKDIPYNEAEAYIYGFTICNDVSARDAMKAYYKMFKGKSMDTFAPLGPCIATVSEFPDLKDIHIETHVNDSVRQRGDTSQLIFDFPEIISKLSRGMTLEPGDIISTGTPAGIGAAMTPPCFLNDGDSVSISVPGIGTLNNTVCFYHRDEKD